MDSLRNSDERKGMRRNRMSDKNKRKDDRKKRTKEKRKSHLVDFHRLLANG